MKTCQENGCQRSGAPSEKRLCQKVRGYYGQSADNCGWHPYRLRRCSRNPYGKGLKEEVHLRKSVPTRDEYIVDLTLDKSNRFNARRRLIAGQEKRDETRVQSAHGECYSRKEENKNQLPPMRYYCAA